MREAEAAVRTLKVRVQPFSVQTSNDLDSAFSAMTGERPGAILVLSDAAFFTLREHIAELAAPRRLPVMYSTRAHVDGGSDDPADAAAAGDSENRIAVLDQRGQLLRAEDKDQR